MLMFDVDRESIVFDTDELDEDDGDVDDDDDDDDDDEDDIELAVENEVESVSRLLRWALFVLFDFDASLPFTSDFWS